MWGLSRYAYVEGNPETLTDPSGNTVCRAGHGCGFGCAGEPAPAAGPTPTSGQSTGATSTSLIKNHSCTGRCQIIMQFLEDANPSGRPLNQWYEQFMLPDMWILTCLGSDAAVCGGSGLPEGNVLSWAEQGPGDLVLTSSYRKWNSERAAYTKRRKPVCRGTGSIALTVWTSMGPVQAAR